MNSIKEGIVKYKREVWFTLKPAWANLIKEGIANYNSFASCSKWACSCQVRRKEKEEGGQVQS